MKKIVFKNGLRLILVPQPSAVTAAILILVEAGSEYETKRNNGVSHFLEHLMFKGTKSRPKPGMISSALDGLGAVSNAFTSQEYTGYYAKVQSGKTGEALDIMTDLYLDPIFEPAEIEKERGVIMEEINLYEDTPARRVHDLFANLLYGDQPAGWDVLGRKKIVGGLRQKDFISYRQERYIPNSTVIAVAGNYDRQAVVSHIEERFKTLPIKKKMSKTQTRESQKKPRALLKFKDSGQTHLVLGVRAFSIWDKRRYAIQVLADYLGGGMSSRLFLRIREELGAAYYVRAGSDLYLDHGFLEISAGIDHRKIKEVIKASLEECAILKEKLITAKDLKRTKDHLIGNFLIGLDTPDELASYYGGQEIITGKALSARETVSKIRAVSADDVRSVAGAIFKDRNLNMALIGPFKNGSSLLRDLHF